MENPFPAYKGDEPYVFVCYAHGDAEVVYPEITWLNDQGFNIWYDEGISPGTVWRDELANSIADANLVLFFVSPNSVDSVNCQREVNYAVDHDTPVLAVHIEETDLPAGMDLTLSTVQALMKHSLAEHDYRIKLLLGVSERIPRGIAAVAPPAAPTATTATGPKLGVIAILAAIIGVAIGWLGFTDIPSIPTYDATVIRAELNLDPEQRLSAIGAIPFAVSPDGKRVAFSAAPSASLTARNTALYLRDLETAVVTSFPGTQGASQPFFSPDGAWIGFFAGGDILKVSAAGGMPAMVHSLPRSGILRGATWTPDNRIVFGDNRGPLRSVPANGGDVEVLTDPGPGEGHWLPHALPTGDLLFTSIASDLRRAQHLSLTSRKVQAIEADGQQSRLYYLPSGHLLWSTGAGGGTFRARLMAARFDPNTLEVGRPVSVIDGIQSSGANGVGYAAISPNGTLVFMPDMGPQLLARMVMVDLSGAAEPISDERIFHYPRLSPNQQTIAVAHHHPNTISHDLFLYEVGRESGTRFTSDVNGHLPLWTPNGQRITFAREDERVGDFDIYWKGLDDEGNGEPLLVGPGRQMPRDWSPDGKRLLYETDGAETGSDLWVLTLDEDPVPFLDTPVDEHSGVFSPDGKFVAYVTNAADGDQVYVRPYPGPGRERRVSIDGGVGPVWPAEGDKLYFRHQNRRDMMGVRITIDDTGEIEEISDPEVVFSGAYTEYGLGGPNYSVSRDGRRFLMLETADRGNTDTQLKLVVNFLTEIERLVPDD